ncbi:peptide deformylase [bacterium BMS3Bbin11]|nr:peptide deformylase [bacterium BMS3Abin11]GBE45840.1 peptide deformylase [bacterium BMS3Bbin11]GMT39935.1 MAG: peptide deformylase [bacterium]HDH16545.1 peptide deformylase [Gammaproteobacteria bacterium]
MALLDILIYPDHRLHAKARPVEQVDSRIQTLIEDMSETMYAAPGIGLAAPQVNVLERIIVIDISDSKDSLLAMVNPEITHTEGYTEQEEGCLSVPGIYVQVSRGEKIHVRALDKNGKPFELAAEGLLGVCLQHEIDHLDGKVFVDYLSHLKQDRIKKKMLKTQRSA